MLTRVILAAVGAVIITGGILLGMSGFVDAFRKRDAVRYFTITDILPRPERGRPERPADAQLPPERRTPAYEGERGRLTLEAPAEPEIGSPAPAAPRPSLDTPERADTP
jgi:hypothetical protein